MRVLRLGVPLMVEAGTVVVKTLSGSTWSDHVPTRQYMTRKGKAATALSSEEYADLLGIIFKQATRAVMKKAGQLIFLHADRIVTRPTERLRRSAG
jgi:nicotinamide riboside kinase